LCRIGCSSYGSRSFHRRGDRRNQFGHGSLDLHLEPRSFVFQRRELEAGAGLVGRVATIVGPVASTKYASSSGGSPTFLDVGVPYPNPRRLKVVIWIENRAAFGRPEVRYYGHTVCVRGSVSMYDGGPQIVARSPKQIAILK
jgi:hypothetical protein